MDFGEYQVSRKRIIYLYCTCSPISFITPNFSSVPLKLWGGYLLNLKLFWWGFLGQKLEFFMGKKNLDFFKMYYTPMLQKA